MTDTYIAKGNKVWLGQSVAVTVWPVRVDETKLNGESWADMRSRTKHIRAAVEEQAAIDAELIASVLNLT